ncbi:Fc.00g053160.m01.CDS01 [Cosmosporella sp. VM-42]
MDERNSAGGALRSALVHWSQFVSQCIAKRLETQRFEEFAQLLYSQHPLPPVVIADFFLRPQPTNHYNLDPRIPSYLQVLSRLRYIDTPSILKALYKYSSSHAQSQSQTSNEEQNANAPARRLTRWGNSYWAEEVFFYSLTKSVVEGRAIEDSKTALEVVKTISKWMTLFTTASTAFAADMLGQLQTSQIQNEMESARAAFVALLLRLCENPVLVKAVCKPAAKDARKDLSASLANFVPTLQIVPHVTEKLELFRTETLAGLDPVDTKKQAANAAMDELLDSTVGLNNYVVADIPISNTRAALYIYVNASLVGRPLIDDHALFSFMNNRYQGDIQSSAVDLILASFDVLANAVFRNEGAKDAHLLRSYLINKVPLLLCQLCPPAFGATSAEFCITEALRHVDTSLFPTPSLMFDETRSNNPYTESVREEFCAACVLHGLIQRAQMDTILGDDMTMSYENTLEKLEKEKLVQNCLSDPEKIQGLVRDVDKMDGNVGAVCQALIELMRQLCNNKETMSLKLLCSQLAQKPLSLDVLLLFEKLPNILEPLCQLLDNWRYEEDQGEYQPVYEEFGAILLLVLAFAYRYNLTAVEIGIQSPDSCIARVLGRGHIGRQHDELTEQENGHINGWIHGLFDTEAGGLGDDLMSSCPPQDFYLLVAPLFQNIVVAYTHGYLNDETLKSGVEYLVDTFLLPSLVPAIRFLSNYLWVDQQEQKSIIKILQLILLPSSISGEASTMLSSVKNLIAQPLEHALRMYQRRDPNNQDIEPLLRVLKDSIPLSRRTGGADHTELDAWTITPSSGLGSAIKHTIQGLVQWSMHPGINSMPTSYTHRQMVAGIKILGPRRTLHVILEEVRHQSEAGSASIVYDVATALICAPDIYKEPSPVLMLEASGNMPPPMQRLQTLREILKAEAEDCKKTQKKDPALAEIVVRLHRRVEAQMVIIPPQPVIQDIPAADMSLTIDANRAALDDAMAAAGVQGDGMSVGDLGLDMNMTADMDIGGSSTGGFDPTADSDIFESLDTTDMEFNWADTMDAMDMT